MKYLYLLRHGKSLWKNYDGNDHERDISKKGIEKTKNVAQKFLLKNEVIELCLYSSSKRTKKTLRIFNKIIQINKKREKKELYHCSGAYIFNLIKKQNTKKSILIIGHEPSFSEFLDIIINSNVKINLSVLGEKIYTSSLIKIAIDVSTWANMNRKSNTLIYHICPDKYVGEMKKKGNQS